MAWTIIAAKKKLTNGYKFAYLRADISGFTHSDQSIKLKIEWSSTGNTNWEINATCFMPYSPNVTFLEIENGIKPNGYFRVLTEKVDPYGTISFSNFTWELR